MTELKLSYTVTSNLRLEDKAVRHLLDVYHQVRDGIILTDVAPPGFVAAVGKLYDDASDSLILHTVVGEIVSHNIMQDVPTCYPSPNHGFHPSTVRVAYQETPATLDPPANSLPMIVFVGNKSVH